MNNQKAAEKWAEEFLSRPEVKKLFEKISGIEKNWLHISEEDIRSILTPEEYETWKSTGGFKNE